MRPLIAGNWKMHGLAQQLGEIETVAACVRATAPAADVLICPPATLLARAARTAAGRIAVGGQDCHTDIAGSFTGDVSAEMLSGAGASAVIVGHSERRQHHGETDGMVAAKASAAQRAGLMAIICIGETEAQRKDGKALSVCGDQIAGSVPQGLASVAIAYEPLWAIGSGHMPTPLEIVDMHAHIRQCLVTRLGAEGRTVRILYGGSVNPSNARDILALPEVGGALVGGASLAAVDFDGILRAVGGAAATIAATTMRVGLAADHGGFVLKGIAATSLRASGYEVVDFGADQLNPEDDYPDFVGPLSRAVAARQVDRAVAFCGSGVGACIAANKVFGVRAGLIHDVFSAHQGVEDDDMNVMCMGGKVVGDALALELIETFMSARFSGAERHRRRLAKVQALEEQES